MDKRLPKTVEEIVDVWGSIRGVRTGDLKDRLERLSDRLVAGAEREKWTEAIESWLVRRWLKGCDAGDAEFEEYLKRADENSCGIAGCLEEGLLRLPWPDDQEVRCFVVSKREYDEKDSKSKRKFRTVLEAIESHLAGHPVDSTGLEIEVEHIMPLKWKPKDWPTVGNADQTRERTIRTLGNLTLVSQELNTDMSNHKWLAKEVELKHRSDSEPFPNLIGDLLKQVGEEGWNEEAIQERGGRLAEYICQIWPVATTR